MENVIKEVFEFSSYQKTELFLYKFKTFKRQKKTSFKVNLIKNQALLYSVSVSACLDSKATIIRRNFVLMAK